jgi:hypothetical protein
VRTTLLALLIGAGSLEGQQGIDIFPIDPKCVCHLTRPKTNALSSKEVVVGDQIQQVFSDRTGKEAFRLDIGFRDAKEGDIKFWLYGLVLERDLNADGILDYSWYGGDDTSHAFRLALSSGKIFRIVDVQKSVSRAYSIRFKSEPPDLADLDPFLGLGDILLQPGRSPVLLATVIRQEYAAPYKVTNTTFRIRQADFVYEDLR